LKYRHSLCLAAAVMVTLALLPVGTSAAAQSAQEFTSSDVQCVVEPVYSFTAPPDAQLNYPDNRLTLGEFSIGELLLANGESLSVTVTPGTLKTSEGDTLPYTVSFDPPETFGVNESGTTYHAAVEIDKTAFRSAASGTYTASLLFEVVSYPAGKTVWQKQTTLTVVKPQSIDDDNVPSTGILESGLFLWCTAATVIVMCILLCLIQACRKARSKKESASEGTEPPPPSE